MTHREIMAISETVADYIGYALANGWQKGPYLREPQSGISG